MTKIEAPLHIVVDGEPTAKQRPRFNPATGKAKTPDKTKFASRSVGWRAREQLSGLIYLPIDEGLIGISMVFYSHHDSASPSGRTDIDNLVKLVMDAFNKVVWDDDWRVVSLNATLVRGVEKGTGYTTITIWDADGTQAKPLDNTPPT